ncbi:MAG TPA: class I SAM-dependent methyltransferase [Thermoanaerobaculia bacterium]|nr:class I SAM-dependent methyltransferase [Thermoanaerobaculia bacterium]
MPHDDTNGWDDYWASKPSGGSSLYQKIATLYRNAFISPGLASAIGRHFSPGSSLLHAGCGSGGADNGLAEVRITAVDISMNALQLYRRSNLRGSLTRASVFELPFAGGSFDGSYNLGVIEHFDTDEIRRMLLEMSRVIRPGGKIVLFWPHTRGSSVIVLGVVHWILHRIFRSPLQLHPPEISLLRSRRHAEEVLAAAGLRCVDYRFGPRDGFVQAIVVAQKGG